MQGTRPVFVNTRARYVVPAAPSDPPRDKSRSPRAQTGVPGDDDVVVYVLCVVGVLVRS